MISHYEINICFHLSVNEELKATGKFEMMDIRIDEAEHSMEMHLPYLAKVFEGYASIYTSSIIIFVEAYF